MVKFIILRFLLKDVNIFDKLKPILANKIPLLNTDRPPNNQNTPPTQAKKSWFGYNFRGGRRTHFYSTDKLVAIELTYPSRV